MKSNKSLILLAMLLLGMLLVGYGLLTQDQAVIKNGMRRDATGQMLDQLGYADLTAGSSIQFAWCDPVTKKQLQPSPKQQLLLLPDFTILRMVYVPPPGHVYDNDADYLKSTPLPESMWIVHYMEIGYRYTGYWGKFNTPLRVVDQINLAGHRAVFLVAMLLMGTAILSWPIGCVYRWLIRADITSPEEPT